MLAVHGLVAKVSDRYLPTPALCWSVKEADDAIGGVMLTASHNPSEYLGFKLRMADGGASPVEFTNSVEAALLPDPPTAAGCEGDDRFDRRSRFGRNHRGGRTDGPSANDHPLSGKSAGEETGEGFQLAARPGSDDIGTGRY